MSETPVNLVQLLRAALADIAYGSDMTLTLARSKAARIYRETADTKTDTPALTADEWNARLDALAETVEYWESLQRPFTRENVAGVIRHRFRIKPSRAGAAEEPTP